MALNFFYLYVLMMLDAYLLLSNLLVLNVFILCRQFFCVSAVVNTFRFRTRAVHGTVLLRIGVKGESLLRFY